MILCKISVCTVQSHISIQQQMVHDHQCVWILNWRGVFLFWGLQSSRATNISSILSVQIQKSSVLPTNISALGWEDASFWLWTSSKLHQLLTPEVFPFSFLNFQPETFDCVIFIMFVSTALTSNKVVFTVLPNTCSDTASSSICLRWMFV